MTANTASWKEKVDPAFDKMIKYFIGFIELSGLPANTGWLGLESEPLKLWEEKGMQGWIKKYEKDMTNEKNTIIKWKISKDVPEQERTKARHDFEKELLEDIKTLPKDSQDYYKKAFAPFYSETVTPAYFRKMSLEQWKELYTDFINDMFLLGLHKFLVEIENEVQNSSKDVLKKKYVRVPIILQILLSLYDSIARLIFEKSLVDLLKEAKNGNEESFFNLLQIDRTIVECDWAQKMIRKAQLTGDEQFFKRMAKAISKPPFENDKEYTTARIAILLFWRLGLRKLDYNEMLELIESCGLKLQESPEAFERFVRRLTSGDLRKDIITFHKDTPATK